MPKLWLSFCNESNMVQDNVMELITTLFCVQRRMSRGGNKIVTYSVARRVCA